MSRLICPTLAFALALLMTMPAHAAGFQDIAALDRGVAAFTGRPIGAIGGARAPVDARLRLAQCPMLSLAWRTEAHDAVVATCTGPQWRIFVPVLAEARAPGAPGAPPAAAAIAPVAKAAPVIRRGDPIMVEAGSPGFSITREGIAMGDAAPGVRLLVRIADSRAPIQAVAVEQGRATLPGWTE